MGRAATRHTRRGRVTHGRGAPQIESHAETRWAWCRPDRTGRAPGHGTMGRPNDLKLEDDGARISAAAWCH